MSTIKGIFEPFQKYVRDQLSLRKLIMSNPKGMVDGVGGILSKDDWAKHNFEGSYEPGEGTKVKMNGATFTNPDYQDYLFAESFDIESQLGSRFRQNPELFYTYTTEKQCIIRMMSGVDIKDIAHENGFLEDHEIGKKKNEALARQFILESGTQYFGGGLREGFTQGEEADKTRGFSVGDKNVRANSDNDFGAVPMPGITDAEIRTKSSDGSLREAKVNFRAHNRRQLAVLEVLYMRPGYVVSLEWGWNPFINNDGERVDNSFSIQNDFFSQESTLESMNKKIREYKVESGGNYDGFIGYIKNFSFKAREDGGYDCTTEIIAHGEILESLKSTKKTVNTLGEIPRYIKRVDGEVVDSITATDFILKGSPGEYTIDETVEAQPEVETIDALLYYLRAIKNNLDKAGDAFYLKKVGTTEDLEIGQTDTTSTCPSYNNESPLIDSELQQQQGTVPYDFYICKYEDGTTLFVPVAGDGSYTSGDLQSFTFINESDTLSYKRNALNKLGEFYSDGFEDIIALYKFINKIKPGSTAEKFINYEVAQGLSAENESAGQGIKSLLGGTIIKQVVKYPSVESITVPGQNQLSTTEDSGYRKNIYVRWDLLCQIMNHMSMFSEGLPPGILEGNDLMEPLTELTYMNPNQPTWSNTPVDKGLQIPDLSEVNGNSGRFYLPYAPPISFPSEPKIDNTLFQPSYTQIVDVMKFTVDLDDPGDPTVREAQNNYLDVSDKPIYHPIIGSSFDERICLMPHQSIFDSLVKMNTTYQDPDATDSDDTREDNPAFYQLLSSYTMFVDREKGVYNNTDQTSRHSIGLIYFNLDFVLDVYESMRLKKEVVNNSEYVTLNRDMSVFDFIKTLWDGVNDATAGFYNFKLHTEHERPGYVRIIDKRVSGAPSNLYEFNPQGLQSVTREFFFDTSIDNDIASTISIAAQAPNVSQDLASISFKAFHKNIKSRFMHSSTEEDKVESATIARDKLIEEVKKYKNASTSLSYYLYKLNQGNFEDDLGLGLIGYSQAIMHAEELPEIRNSILRKYPLDHKNAGQWRGETPAESHEVIPLKFNAKLDGISGIIPLQLFKVNKSKLPKGYERDDLAFIVSSETHKITDGQDWTVDISGQMVILNKNYNYDGYNNLDNIRQVEEIPIDGRLDWLEDSWELSGQGVALLKTLEGFRPYTYEDPPDSGNYSVGYGTQTWEGDSVSSSYPNSGTPGTNGLNGTGSPVTETIASQELQSHLKTIYEDIRKYVTVPLTENEYDSIVLYVYNVGQGNSLIGTNFISELNQGNYAEAAKEMDIICSGGVVNDGLIERRAKEQALFTNGLYLASENDYPPRRGTGCFY